MLAFVHASATAVWPPTGISLAVLLLFGYRLWPGVALGASLVNVSVGVPVVAAMGIATGNTLEALCAAWLLQRFAFRPSLDRLQDVLGLVVCGAMVSTAISATVGVSSVWLTGMIPSSGYARAWWAWWVGDAIGDLVIAPLLLVWSTPSHLRIVRRRKVEATALLTSLVAACVLVFERGASLRTFALFPCLVWAAVRFGQPGVTMTTFVTSAVALWSTAAGFGPFASSTLEASLLGVQTFMGVVTLTALALAAIIAERQAAAEALQESEARYRDLFENANDLVQAVAPDGRLLYANRAWRTTLGYGEQETAGLSLWSIVHPESQAHCAEIFQRVIGGERFDLIEATFVAKNGIAVTVEGSCSCRFENGAPVAIRGIFRDITERKRVEEEKAALLELATEISGTLDLDRILAHVERRLALLLQCDAVVTLYWDPPRRVFRMISQYGIPAELLAAAQAVEFQPGEPIIEDLTSGRSVMIGAGTETSWMPVELRHRFEPGALVGVPLTVRDQLRGALVAARVSGGRPLEGRQLQFLEGVARQVAVALAATELYRAQQEETHVSSALARVGRELISSFNKPQLLDRLCRLTTEVLGCDCSHTFLWQPEEDVYVPVASYGYPPDQWEWLRTLKVPRAMMAGQLEILERDEVRQLSLGEFPDSQLAELARQLALTVGLGMAFRRGEQMIGFHSACYRGRREPFTALQERIALGIARLGSLALDNAQLMEELAQASRVKSDFVATMSHELRTPLNAIMGYTDLILEGTFGTLTPEQSESLQRVVKSSRELHELINATLDLSRLDTGGTPLELSEVQLADLLRDVDRDTRELQEQPGLTVQWQVATGLPRLHTDAAKVKMVIKNLIGNAVKFTEKGTVTVAAHPYNGGVEIAVADTGPGIDPEVLPIIFEPFRQADSSSTRRYGGVGLGLYIVRRFVDMLGGTVNVSSELGHGATFRVWIPTNVREKAA